LNYRGNTADANIRATVVVSPEPLCGEVLGLLNAVDDVIIPPFMPDGAVVALDVGVLLGLTGLDVG
jgi:hypothetical protein